MTAQFEEKLKLVETGKLRVDDFTAEYEAFILEELKKIKGV